MRAVYAGIVVIVFLFFNSHQHNSQISGNAPTLVTEEQKLAPDSETQNWDYDPCTEGSPAYWGSRYPLCGIGQEQSPIDLETFESFTDKSLTPLKINWGSGTGDVFFNGETCQVKIENDTMSISGGPLGNDEYHMVQFHTHEVSEHHVDGVAYPLEIHFVHKNVHGSVAVVGLFFKISQNNSTFISEFIENCLMGSDEGAKSELDFHLLIGDVSNKLPYYTYQGSLTTPPCSENVTWILLPTFFEVSRAQLKEFMDLLPHNNANNRPIQKLNNRVIRYFDGGLEPPKDVKELGTWYEICSKSDLAKAQPKYFTKWNDFLLSLGQLDPGETKYGVMHLYDPPSFTNYAVKLEHLRIHLMGISSSDTVSIRIRQMHSSIDIPNAASFLSLSKSDRQEFYQKFLPMNTDTDNDEGPVSKNVTGCDGDKDYFCSYILNNPQIEDYEGLLSVFLFEITNNGAQQLSSEARAQVLAGDYTPSCKNSQLGILLGSLWTLSVVIIIAGVMAWLSWEERMLEKQNVKTSM